MRMLQTRRTRSTRLLGGKKSDILPIHVAVIRHPYQSRDQNEGAGYGFKPRVISLIVEVEGKGPLDRATRRLC